MAFRPFDSDLTAKIVSVIFAILLWFSIAMQGTYTYRVDIPLRIAAPGGGLMLASEPLLTSEFALSGTGRHLLAFTFERFLHPESVFLSVPTAGLGPGTHTISLDQLSLTLPGSSTIRVDGILTNEIITLDIDRRISRTVRVDVNHLPPYTVRKNCVLTGDPTATPAEITVEGPEKVMDTIGSLRVIALGKNLLSVEDSVVTADIETPAEFVTLGARSVAIHFPLEPMESKVMPDMPVTFRGIPSSTVRRISPQRVSVTLHGPASVMAGLKSSDISVVLTNAAFVDFTRDGGTALIVDVLRPRSVTASTDPETLTYTPPSAK